jgi:hypothetical protein
MIVELGVRTWVPEFKMYGVPVAFRHGDDGVTVVMQFTTNDGERWLERWPAIVVDDTTVEAVCPVLDSIAAFVAVIGSVQNA